MRPGLGNLPWPCFVRCKGAATWRITYRGIVPDKHLANLSYEWRANGWYQILSRAPEVGNFTFVAEGGTGEIVGFAIGLAVPTLLSCWPRCRLSAAKPGFLQRFSSKIECSKTMPPRTGQLKLDTLFPRIGTTTANLALVTGIVAAAANGSRLFLHDNDSPLSQAVTNCEGTHMQRHR